MLNSVDSDEIFSIGPSQEIIELANKLTGEPSIDMIGPSGKSSEFLMKVQQELKESPNPALSEELASLIEPGKICIPDEILDIEKVPEDLRHYIVTEVDPNKPRLEDYIDNYKEIENADEIVELEMAEKYEEIMRLITEGKLTDLDSKTALHLIKKMVFGKTPEDFAKVRWDFGIPKSKSYKIIVEPNSLFEHCTTYRYSPKELPPFSELEFGNYRKTDIDVVREEKLLGVPRANIVPLTNKIFEGVEAYIASRKSETPDYTKERQVQKDLEFCAKVRALLMDIHPFSECNSRISTFFMCYLQQRLFEDKHPVNLVQENAMQFMLPNISDFKDPEMLDLLKKVYGEDLESYGKIVEFYRRHLAPITRFSVINKFIKSQPPEIFEKYKEQKLNELQNIVDADFTSQKLDDVVTSMFIKDNSEKFGAFFANTIEETLKVEEQPDGQRRSLSSIRSIRNTENGTQAIPNVSGSYNVLANAYAEEISGRSYKFGQVEIAREVEAS